MLGNPLAQDVRGDPIRDVIDRGARLEATSTVRYSDTRQGGNLHTDGCHRLGHVPDVFTLYCVRQASSGGALVLVHVSDLLETLGGQPEVLDALRLPVHFDTRDDQTPGVPRTVRRPILDTVDGTARIHYLREYIDSAYRRLEVPPLSAQQAGALKVLDTLLDRTDLQARRRLRPGEMIVVNNRSVIHGRTAFPAELGPGGRLLLRSWIAAARGMFGESEPDAPPSEVADGDSHGSPV
jgi:alpha-ketoglutarate-dependent taurine dioxygenase